MREFSNGRIEVTVQELENHWGHGFEEWELTGKTGRDPEEVIRFEWDDERSVYQLQRNDSGEWFVASDREFQRRDLPTFLIPRKAWERFDFESLNRDERQELLTALRFAVNWGARYRNHPVVIRYTDDQTFDCVPSVYIEPGNVSQVTRRGYETVVVFSEEEVRKGETDYQIVDPTGVSLADYSDGELWRYVAG